MSSPSSIPQGSVQEIAPGLTCEYLDDGQIIIITAYKTPSRELVDLWQQTISEYAHNRHDKRHYIVYDLSNVKNFPLTPYPRQRLIETAKQNKDVSGCCAVILSRNSFIRSILQLFIARDSARTQPNLKIKIFGKRDLGIAWVQQATTNHDNQS